MHSPAPEIVAGYSSGCVVDKDANPETTLGSAYSPVDYMSITSFPRLPEDDMVSGENTLKSRKDDDNVLSEQDTGESHTITTKYTHPQTFKLSVCMWIQAAALFSSQISRYCSLLQIVSKG